MRRSSPPVPQPWPPLGTSERLTGTGRVPAEACRSSERARQRHGSDLKAHSRARRHRHADALKRRKRNTEMCAAQRGRTRCR
ncbi:hypothetical protein SKAU_G00430210 [Synaphobranchus kaupii]|uniref:Uncharacterized protein n=1 Tax=Synaphobranchus kaupii TaxID=118154 RepID=A0A9Q1IA11_SYNKA|nr:hypothetical protein SKAU_G00430210 [Synaphobranchus kaupii]